MSKVCLVIARPDGGAPLSSQFGLAEWISICDTEGEQRVLERNRWLYGMGVVGILERHHCTDAIFSNIWEGAFEALKAAKIRGWRWPESVPTVRLTERLKRGEFEKAGENVGDH
jgi:predicted Fe-Mo cluster-binding NifX family protein